MKNKKEPLHWHVKERKPIAESVKNLYSSEPGWGNGYVSIPKDHPYYNEELETADIDIKVHGGITLDRYIKYKSEDFRLIGFDTAHLEDNITYWTKDRVIEETKALELQIRKGWEYYKKNNIKNESST